MALKVANIGQSLCKWRAQGIQTGVRGLTTGQIEIDWATNPRWEGVERRYTPEDVAKLSNSVHVEHTLAKLGAEKLWKSMKEEPYVNALGAVTGNQVII